MVELFSSDADLKQLFNIDEHPEYENFTPTTNAGVLCGFTVNRSYPSTSKYSPPVNKDGTADTYAKVALLYDPKIQVSGYKKDVPFVGEVNLVSRYEANHWEYDFEDDDCPTIESIEKSKRTPKPIGLRFDDYSYDIEKNAFIDEEGQIISGIDIIDRMYKDHLDTVDKYKGLILRIKLKLKEKIEGWCEETLTLLHWILKTVFGRKLESDDPMRGVLKEYQLGDVKLLKIEDIDVFGYKASKNVIVTFCLILLLCYSVFKFSELSSSWLKGIVSNNLLAFAFSIICLAILDNIIPRLILRTINIVIRIREWLVFLKFTFK